MTKEEKREMIERALERFWQVGQVTHRPPIPCPYLDFDALAEQAIVEKGTWYPEGRFVKDGATYNWCKNPMRCTAIILPLQKED